MENIFTQYRGLKKEIYILFVGKLVTAMGSFVWPMLTFFLTTKLGLSDGISTFLIATASILSLPAALLGGKLADRYSRKSIIILFDFMTVSLYILSAILPIGYYTAAFVFLAGLFQTIETPAYDALNSDFSTTEQREKAFSLSYLGFNLGYIVGASVSGILFENYTWLAFLLNGVSILSSTILIILFVNMKKAVTESADMEQFYSEYERPMDEKLSVFSVLKDRKVVLGMMLIGCVASMPTNLTGILLPLQLKENLGQTGASIYGYLNSLNGFTVILLTPLLTILLIRFTEIPKVTLGHLLFTAGMVLFALNKAIWLLFVGMFIYTIGEVVSVLGNNPYTSKRIPSSHRGRVGGISSVVYSLFSSLTQYAISAVLILSGSNYPLIWTIFIVIGIIACLLFAFCYRFDRKRFPNLYQNAKL